jgi:hypothetical protein
MANQEPLVGLAAKRQAAAGPSRIGLGVVGSAVALVVALLIASPADASHSASNSHTIGSVSHGWVYQHNPVDAKFYYHYWTEHTQHTSAGQTAELWHSSSWAHAIKFDRVSDHTHADYTDTHSVNNRSRHKSPVGGCTWPDGHGICYHSMF